VASPELAQDAVYRLAPTDHFAGLRALIPPGAYGGMLARVLRDHPIYTTVRVEYGQDYAGPPEPGARYDYGIFYRDQLPDEAGFADATVVWEDAIVRVYKLAP
jgi:hypothetical protein